MDTNTDTQPADNVIATTPEPVADSWQENLSKRLQPPKIERPDYSSLDAENPTPVGIEEVSDVSSEEFLRQIDAKDEPVAEEKKSEKKTKETKQIKTLDDLNIDDLDLSKDPEPVVEKPTKKSKEDNIAELRKKAEAYELDAKSKEQKLAEYQKKLETIEAELERTAFERSPKFKEKFQAPYEESISKAMAFAQEYAEDISVAEKALSLKGKERLEYIDEAFGGGAASAQFLSLVNDVDGKLGSLTEAMNNHKETAIKITQEEENQRKANTEKIIRNFDRVAEHLASKTEFFRKGDDEEANAEVENRIKAAKAIMLGEATENDMMMTPFLAVMAKDAISKLAKVEAELEKYKARAKSDSAVQPRINRASSDDESKSSKPKSALESIRSSLRGL